MNKKLILPFYLRAAFFQFEIAVLAFLTNIIFILLFNDSMLGTGLDAILVYVIVFLLLSILLARQAYFKFHYFNPGYLKGAVVDERIWIGDTLFPLFGKILLLTGGGMVLSSSFYLNPDGKGFFHRLNKSLFFSKSKDVLIDIQAIDHVEITRSNSATLFAAGDVTLHLGKINEVDAFEKYCRKHAIRVEMKS